MDRRPTGYRAKDGEYLADVDIGYSNCQVGRQALERKPRVHELARELAVPAKDVLAWLGKEGIFANSVSSRVAITVATRLRADTAHWNQCRAANAKVAGSRFTRSGAKSAARPDAARSLTDTDKARIRERFRLAYTSGNSDHAALETLIRDCVADYGVARGAVREIIIKDRMAHPGEYVPRPDRNGSPAVVTPSVERPRDVEGQRSGALASSTPPPGRAAPPARPPRPRPRSKTLPAGVAVADPQSIADLIMNLDTGATDRDEILTRIAEFSPDNVGHYGYLAWRFSAAHRLAGTGQHHGTPQHDLAIIARVVDSETEFLERVLRTCGPILDRVGLARRTMEGQFGDLADDFGQSAADERRRARARDSFLRTAVVLAIADPGVDQRLWDMLDQCRPPVTLVETNGELEAAMARLTDNVAAVESLLAVDEVALDQFFAAARSELDAMRAGRYDFLRQFRDLEPAAGTNSRRAVGALPFEVLPRGEKIREFLNGIRDAGRYNGYEIDDQRVAVLDEIAEHFGGDRCALYTGAASSNGINDKYLILTIECYNGTEHHAATISPLAGVDATFVVRVGCAKADWGYVFAQSKAEAVKLGAHRFLFTANHGGTDRYSGMRDKVIALLECARCSSHEPGPR